MNHLSLFSGIGGLDLAAEWAGFKTVAFVERDPYCQRVLAKHWPDTPIFSNVRDVANAGSGRRGGESGGEVEQPRGAEAIRAGSVRLVSGGFPCQPHSVAGKRQASADDHDLWPEFARVIREIRPRWVVAENVPGLLSSESGRFFGTVLRDLAEMGYSAGWGVWGACDVGALHRRDRVFIVAHAAWDEPGRPEQRAERQRIGECGESGDVADAGGSGPSQRVVLTGIPGGKGRADPREDIALGGEAKAHAGQLPEGRGAERSEESGRRPFGEPTGPGWWESEPDVGRVAHGVPARVDRLRALGNAVVPQQAYPLFRAIAEIEGMKTLLNQGTSQ